MTREVEKSTFLNKKMLFAGAGIVLLILIILTACLGFRSNAEIIIVAAPTKATIRLDGKKIDSGVKNVRPGKHTVIVSLDGLETKTQEIEVATNETKSVNIYLAGEGDDFSAYLKNEEDIDRLALIGDEAALEFVSNYRQAKTITELLPLTIIEDYGESSSKLTLGKDCERSYCLKITDKGEALKEKMLAKIKALGYNPDDYEIRYELVDGENEE